ncbi:hypothetical protein PDJ86_22475 [Bacillus cereus group sp. TH36-2LC]|uniref:hypothetical protein n=1 Tax=Bacillus cereus group sp. TH36-2LC TaxID=3018040 RepID=UPI0022E17F1D|nr:hypothetical protein [Bacillus cereus group sp. TH36-2LC]MDA1509626.1 hypothetical protein [Bacillus cereus group sp. TH36-2LC]
MGLTEILTVVFIVLKLTGVIDWSWWLVLLPELLAIGLYVIVVTVGGIITGKVIKHTFKKRK